MGLVPIDAVSIVALLGALLGSVKSSLDSDREPSRCVRLFNILIGIFCGLNIAHIFHKELELGYIGLIALVGAMVGANILEVISDLAPDMVKRYIKKQFK